MIAPSTLGLTAVFAAGVVSFLSPCVLPVVPGYISYIAGHSFHDREGDPGLRERLQAMWLSLFFVLGFSTVFLAFGASATVLGRLLLSHRSELNLVGGIIVIGFGLFMLGLARHVRWIHQDWRIHPRLRGGHPGAAYVLGLAFGFGWTPCIGPVLGTILTMSAMTSTVAGGIKLLAVYAAGLGIPFLAAALFMRTLLLRLKSLRHLGRPFQILAGLVMVAVGIAMATGELTRFSYWLLDMFPVLGRIG